ncbi:hypothetical protein POV27_00370 [Aureisphaera galaxeae]|uniref:YybH family protein n=1 Tax=Aureisphaera galaxeae TaxID=1538023 RepID=UPI00234FCE05|nr:hypothetical protein [Aureisphaera galaxeae]MDC8002490.1 hypothetical protein [Aureisphaera galaxeae]
MKSKSFTFRLHLLISAFLLFSYTCLGQEVKNDSEYHPNVVGLAKNGIFQGHDVLKNHLSSFQNKHGNSHDFKTLHKIAVHDKMHYEIGSFQTENGDKFAQVIIWVGNSDAEQKILEAVYAVSPNKDTEVLDKITKARNKWVKLCNKHDAEKLVSELYTDDAIYYNRGRILRGHGPLSTEYSYMNSSSYSLQLNPKHVEVVNENIVFEVGRCSGSYPLPYLLIWKKQADGSWKIYMDSNY